MNHNALGSEACLLRLFFTLHMSSGGMFLKREGGEDALTALGI